MTNMTNPWASQLQLISNLIAEKDRLVKEKDDLVASKDKLWREMFQIVQERDEEIESLRTEQYRLHVELSMVSYPTLTPGRKRKRSDRDDDVEESEHFEGSKAETNDDFSETAQVELRAKKQRVFEFLPLIRVTQDGVYEFGKIDDVATSVIDAIQAVVKTIENQRRTGAPHPTKPPSCCAHWWAKGQSAMRRWTVRSPKAFACFSCFNARRACLYWLGNMQWMILPLPQEARHKNASWQNKEYYIYSGREKGAAFPNVWEPDRKPAR